MKKITFAKSPIIYIHFCQVEGKKLKLLVAKMNDESKFCQNMIKKKVKTNTKIQYRAVII